MQRRRADQQRTVALSHRRLWLCFSLAVMLAVSAASAGALWSSQAHNQHEVEQRFLDRTELAADFVATYVDQLMQREQDAAVAMLASGTGSFDAVVASFGFPAALLLDGRGRVLAVTPPKPEIIGTAIASRYPHLRTALDGRRGVSPVVASAATGEPVVAFAVPFDTPTGRRVFSGAYSLRRTPLKSYLNALTSLPGAQVYLVDEAGEVLANAGPIDQVGRLAVVQPQVADAVRDRRAGEAGDTYFVSWPADGTPWRVVTTVPTASLLAPVQGPARYVPWIVLALLVITAFVICALMYRLLQGRDRLHAVNARLDTLAQTDALTGVRNRRATAAELTRLLDVAQQSKQPLAALMVDVDHFKRVNDTFGHGAGDAVLVEVAARLSRALRTDDVIGRWGGEEFLVLLAGTDEFTAAFVADRLRAAVADRTIPVGTGGDDITVTVSIGSASSASSATSATAGADVLVAAADRGLYIAKRDGRNLVRADVG